MKYMYVFICFLLLTSCGSDHIEMTDGNGDITACGVHQPQEHLPWLRKLIETAETDTTAQCLGTIWLVRYRGQDIFVTNMGFGSGGVLYWFLDCAGNHLDGGGGDPSAYIGNGCFSVEDPEELGLFVLSLKLSENRDVPVVYSNIPL
ncbi:MAG: hypothetical protein LBP50_05425 [Tannerella sp.]|jgi:hypothetical protein|nr:hypothetical protein [Tannerella sp.]